MKPIKIEQWQCPICQTIYSDENEAIACSDLPKPEPRFKAGDTVYVPERYPDDDKKPFVSVKIQGVFDFDVTRGKQGKKHEVRYLLEEAVQIGKDYFIGRTSQSYDSDRHNPALESELYAIGDLYMQNDFVTEDLVGDQY